MRPCHPFEAPCTLKLLSAAAFVLAGCAGPQPWNARVAAGEKAASEGRYAEAESSYKAALSEAQAAGPADPRIPESLERLGRLYVQEGQLSQAEPLYRQAVAAEMNLGG